MQAIVPGQRSALAALGIGDALEVEARVHLPGCDVDVAIFGLDPHGKLSDDRYMVFYGQAASPCAALRQSEHDPQGAKFTADLGRLPASIERLVVCASIDGAGALGGGSGATLNLSSQGRTCAQLSIGPETLGALRAVMIAELYRKDGSWRLWASAQGFNGGLDALVRHFGGEVAEDSAPASRPGTPPGLSLEKKVAEKAPHLVSLAKKASVVLEKRRLGETVCRVALVLDASGSMMRQYEMGRVQEVVDRILPLAVHFDDDGALDCWAFAREQMALAPVTLDNVRGYVEREKGGWRQWMNKLHAGWNNEPVVIQAVMEMYRDSALPAYVIFISDGGVGSSDEIAKLLTKAAQAPVFWQFVGIGGSSYGVLEHLDTMSGRVVDNCNFFALDDLHEIDEATLYDRLLSELPDWLQAARRAGILR